MKIRYTIYTLAALALGFCSTTLQAQEAKPAKKAWEVGVGGALINWNRVSISGFESRQDDYFYNFRVDHLMGGAKLYVARELNKWFYLDLQGTMGITYNNPEQTGKSGKHSFLFMGGPGLQFRLSPLFGSEYVEPYLRVGANYLWKDFQARNIGRFSQDPTGQAGWSSKDTWNGKDKLEDKNQFFPISVGAGVNAWLNNSVGLGLQGEYIMPIRKELPRFAQVSLNVLFRFGGKDKRPQPRIEYVEVEKPVEKIVEKIVEKKVFVEAEPQVGNLLENINFGFDRYDFTPESEKALDNAAKMLKKQSGQYFLITGYTDAQGNQAYNFELSRKRAQAVVNALIERGVPASMLKWRGVGKKVNAVPASESDDVREGDRKITIERVSNIAFWNKLP